jgi:hypothetical protein
MGRSQLVSAGLIAVLAALGLVSGACGEPESLLVPADVSDVYGEGGAFGPKSYDKADFQAIQGVVTFKGRQIKAGDLPLSDDFCINANPDGMASEEFQFDPDSGALEGVYVFLSKGVNKRLQDLHPVPSEPVILDQIGCRYVPHHVILRVGQPLVIKSSDSTLHNVKMSDGRNKGFNEVINAPGTLPARTFDLPEPAPRMVKCDVHGWMRAFIAVMRHPYCVITGKDGTYKLEGVPPGTYELTFWHEKKDLLPPASVTVTVEAGKDLETNHEFTR